MKPTYTFRPLRDGDLPLIRQWLDNDHVQAWWPDPRVQYDLISGDMYEPTIDLYLVLLERQPFAYVQDYCVQDWMQPHLADRPEGTRAIDLFIGDTRFLGKGHGSGLLRQHARNLLNQGAPQIVIDPEPDNTAAIYAYRAAGFTCVGVRDSDDGPALLMQFHET